MEHSPSETGASLHITLHPEPLLDRRFWWPALVLLGLLIVHLLYSAAMEASLGPANLWVVARSILIFLVCVGILRLVLRRSSTSVLRVTPDDISFTRNRDHTVWTSIAITSLQALDLRGRGPFRRLFISNGSKHFRMPLALLDIPEEKLMPAIAEVVTQAPANRELWLGLRNKAELAALLSRRPVWATWTLAALLVGVFGVELVTGALRENLLLLDLGAISAPLVEAGQWQRVFLGTSLHMNLGHLINNLLGLLLLGHITERLLGSYRFVLIYLVSGAAGALVSLAFKSPMVAVGASGAVFGIAGAALWLDYRYRKDTPTGFMLPRWVWWLVLADSILAPLFSARVDWHAHAGGFVAGLLLAMLLKPELPGLVETATGAVRKSGMLPARSLALPATGALYVLALLSFVGLSSPQQTRATLISALEDEVENHEGANMLAWLIAIGRDVTSEQLVTAEQLMRPIIADIERNTEDLSADQAAAYLDTFATVKYKQGEFAEAVTMERQALLRTNKRNLRDSFALFLEAYFRQRGILLGGAAGADDVELHHTRHADGRVELVVERRHGSGHLVVAVLAHRAGRREGYHLCNFQRADSLTLLDGDEEFGVPAAALEYSLAMIDTLNYRSGDDDLCRKANVSSTSIF